MSKKIIVEGKNGAENIRLSRLETRNSNLEEDLIEWKQLIKEPCSNELPIFKNKNGRLVKDPAYKKTMSVGSTIAQRIFSKRADYYNISNENQVTREMISELANEYVKAHHLLQLEFCRDPSRQSIDEEVQKATLEKYLPNATIDKPTNGVLTLVNGDIIKKPKKDKVEARSIDFVVINGFNEFNIFAKFSLVSGSGQSHQADESRRFLQESVKYTNKHNDKKYFIALLDGGEAESHIPELKELFKEFPRLFVGNCENVINFINSIK
jgi:hypothetical protein